MKCIDCSQYHEISPAKAYCSKKTKWIGFPFTSPRNTKAPVGCEIIFLMLEILK